MNCLYLTIGVVLYVTLIGLLDIFWPQLEKFYVKKRYGDRKKQNDN